MVANAVKADLAVAVRVELLQRRRHILVRHVRLHGLAQLLELLRADVPAPIIVKLVEKLAHFLCVVAGARAHHLLLAGRHDDPRAPAAARKPRLGSLYC